MDEVHLHNSTTRNYDFKVRIASPYTTAKVSLSLDGNLISAVTSVRPPAAGRRTRTRAQDNQQVTSGTHILTFNTDNGGFNLNNIGVSVSATGAVCGNANCEAGETCSSCSSDCGSCSTEGPYGGTAASLPACWRWTASTPAAKASLFTTTTSRMATLSAPRPTSTSKHQRLWCEPWLAQSGEYVKFTVNVLTAGNYDMTIQTAGNGGTFKFSTTGATTYDSGTLNAAATGQWQTYSPVTKTGIALNAGTTVIKLEMLANVAFNLKKMQFAASGTGTGGTGPAPVIEWPYGTTQQTPTPIAVPSRIEAENSTTVAPRWRITTTPLPTKVTPTTARANRSISASTPTWNRRSATARRTSGQVHHQRDANGGLRRHGSLRQRLRQQRQRPAAD